MCENLPVLLGQPASSGVPGTGTLVRLDRRPEGTMKLVPVSVLLPCERLELAPHHRLARMLTPPGLRRTAVPETTATSTTITISHEAADYFIDLVRERPALWDVDNKDYSKRDIKDSMWNDAVSQMKKNWPAYGPYTAASLCTLFNNKRRTYRKERKKIRPKSGHDSVGVYVGKWRFFRSMSFLESMAQKRDLSGAVDEEAMDRETPPPESFHEVLLPDDVCDNNLQFSIISATSVASTTSLSPDVGQSQPESSSKRPRKPDVSCAMEPFELDTTSQPAPKTARTVAETAECGDAAVYFGKIVTALLRPLSPKKLVKCQADILTVIERYLVE
ncbi:uncharacterized protein LOC144103451 [Amblyomma americanum]